MEYQKVRKLRNGKTLIELLVGELSIARIKFDDFDKPVLYIEDLYIDKGFRRQGLATRLIREVFEYANALECSVVSLYVGISNKKAQFLYTKVGFLIAFIKSNKHGDKYWLMSKQM